MSRRCGSSVPPPPVFWWSAYASMVTGSHSWLRQGVKSPVLHKPTGRGRGEPYVISHSVAEAAGSRGTGRKSNSCSTVQHGCSWKTTSGDTGQQITDLVFLCLLSHLFPVRHQLTFVGSNVFLVVSMMGVTVFFSCVRVHLASVKKLLTSSLLHYSHTAHCIPVV